MRLSTSRIRPGSPSLHRARKPLRKAAQSLVEQLESRRLLSVTDLSDTADTYVQDGTNANTNFGSYTAIQAKQSTSGLNRQSYLKFDISSLITISSATLRLYGHLNTADTVPIVAYQAGNTTWSESTLTWNTPKPGTTGSALSTTNITTTSDSWYTWDLTSFVQAEKTAGHSTISIALIGNTNTSAFASFSSKEATSNTPVLRIDNSTTHTLSSTADTYAQDGTNAGTNFGSGTGIQAKQSSAGLNRHAYLKFDLSSITGTINSATLKLFGILNSADTVPILAYQAGNATWGESTLTWNNQPGTIPSSLGTTNITSTVGAWYTWDLTSFIQAQKTAGATTVSIALIGNTNTSAYATFNSKEATSNQPQLVILTSNDVPTAPSNLTIDTPTSSSQLTLHWTDNSNNETGFKIDRATNSTFTTGLTPFTVAANIVTYTDTGVSPNTTYYYRVRAYNGSGDSANTGTASATTLDVVPAPPIPISPTLVHNTSVTIDWTDQATNETGYTVSRLDEITSDVEIYQLAANSTSFSQSDLTPGGWYTYSVTAANAIGSSTAATFEIGVAVPVTANASVGHKVEVSWDPIQADANVHLIRTDPDSNTVTLTPTAGGTSFTDTGLKESTTYQYNLELDGGDWTATRDPTPVTTLTPTFYDGTGNYWGRATDPNDSQVPVPLAHTKGILGKAIGSFFDSNGNVTVDAIAAEAVMDQRDVYIDVEDGNYPTNIYTVDTQGNYVITQDQTDKVQNTINKITEIISDLKQYWANHTGGEGLQVGLYALIDDAADMYQDVPSQNLPGYVEPWHQSNDYIWNTPANAAGFPTQPLSESVDMIMPSIYADDQSVDAQLSREARSIQEAYRVDTYNKPVIPFIWPYFFEQTRTVDPPNQPLSAGDESAPHAPDTHYWNMVLDQMRNMADGAIMWSNGGEAVWSDSLPWVTAMEQLLTTPVQDAPAAVTSLSASGVGLKLHWDAVDGADYYSIERSLNGGAYRIVGDASGTETDWSDPDLIPGATATYRIEACNAFGTSTPTSSATVTAARDPLLVTWAALSPNTLNDPNAPADAFGSAPGVPFLPHNIPSGDLPYVGWWGAGWGPEWLKYSMNFQSSENVTSFMIDTGSPDPSVVQLKIDCSDSDVANTGTLLGTFNVPATNSIGSYAIYQYQTFNLSASIPAGVHNVYLYVTSGGFHLDEFQFGDSSTGPAQPTNLSANSTGGAVSLSWKDWSQNEDGFVVERASDPNGTWSQIGTTTGTTFIDTSPTTGTNYYRVKSYRNLTGGETVKSPRSNIDIGTGATRDGTGLIQAETDDAESPMNYYEFNKWKNTPMSFSSSEGFPIPYLGWGRYLGVDFSQTPQNYLNVNLWYFMSIDQDNPSASYGFDVYIDAPSTAAGGTKIGSWSRSETDPNQSVNWHAETENVQLTQPVTGVHDVYFVNTADTGQFYTFVDSFGFSASAP